MFTLIHAFANYFLAVPFRKRIDVIALLVASLLPDLEGLYFVPAAYAACGAAAEQAACRAEYPSHFFLHSFLGAFIVVAVITTVATLFLRKYLKLSSVSVKIIYASALAGALLHMIADLTYHTGGDALYLFWPLPQQYSLAFPGSELLWTALAGAGMVSFAWIEGKRLRRPAK